MTGRVIFYVSLALWAVTTGVLVREEILPLYQPPEDPEGYEILLAGVTHDKQTWMTILVEGEPAGKSESGILRQQDGSFLVYSRSEVDMRHIRGGGLGRALPLLRSMLGADEEDPFLRSSTTVWVDANYDLRSFDAKLLAGGVRIWAQKGEVDRNGMLEVETSMIGAEAQTETMERPTHALLSGDWYSPFEVPDHLRVGDRWTTVRINPMSQERIIYRGWVSERVERFEWNGENHPVYVVVVTNREYGTEVKMFVTGDGVVLEQHLPYDTVLRLDPTHAEEAR